MSFTLRAIVLLLLLLLLLLGYHTPEGIHFIIETGKRCFAIRSLALFHSPSPFLSLSLVHTFFGTASSLHGFRTNLELSNEPHVAFARRKIRVLFLGL